MFGQTTYTGNLPAHPAPQPHSPERAQRALQQVPGSSWLHAGPDSQVTSIPPVLGLLTCRVWAGSSDRSSSGNVHTTPPWFFCSPEAEPSRNKLGCVD